MADPQRSDCNDFNFVHFQRDALLPGDERAAEACSCSVMRRTRHWARRRREEEGAFERPFRRTVGNPPLLSDIDALISLSGVGW